MTEFFLHFLNKILQMSKFKFFISWKIFSRIADIVLKLANVKHNSKIQDSKIQKVAHLLAGQAEKLADILTRCRVKLKIWHAIATLEHHVKRLARHWHVGKFGRFSDTLARKNWHVGMLLAHWHVGTLACRPHWHASHTCHVI